MQGTQGASQGPGVLTGELIIPSQSLREQLFSPFYRKRGPGSSEKPSNCPESHSVRAQSPGSDTLPTVPGCPPGKPETKNPYQGQLQ